MVMQRNHRHSAVAPFIIDNPHLQLPYSLPPGFRMPLVTPNSKYNSMIHPPGKPVHSPRHS